MDNPLQLQQEATWAVSAPNHQSCRICHQRLPKPFLDFGPMPLANAFLSLPEETAGEAYYPLAATCCPGCGLVQLNHVVPAEQLYRRYIYVSSTSEAVRTHAEWLATDLIRRYHWCAPQLLVEIASNDGTVLKAFQRVGMRVLGVEPAANIATVATAEGVPTVIEFFNAQTARGIAARQGRAVCILGRHVFAHIDDLHDLLEGVDALLSDDGVFIIEVPYLVDLLDNLEFDTIYHEHLSYISLAPVARLCEQHGFQLVDVQRVLVHGGSILLSIRRAGGGVSPTSRLEAMRREEEQRRLANPETLRDFAGRVLQWKEAFEGCIEDLSQSGARLSGYGAAAKANTLLNVCPTVARRLGYILDRSPHKHGRYTPGTHLFVRDAKGWEDGQVTHLLILAWNLKEEIMRQMGAFAQRGGQFVIPIPKPEVIGA